MRGAENRWRRGRIEIDVIRAGRGREGVVYLGGARCTTRVFIYAAFRAATGHEITKKK